MIRDIRIAERWLGREELYIDPSVEVARQKLERSIASRRALPVGHLITQDVLHLLSPGDCYKWSELSAVVGKRVVKAVEANEIIYPDVIE